MRVSASILLVVGLSCRGAGSASEEGRPQVAKVAGLAGSVEVLRSGAEGWGRIMRDAVLYDDDRVRTFKNAWAQVLFLGGSSLRVEEESLIALGAISLGAGITVERGTVEGELQPGLKLKTPTAEAESAHGREIVVQ